jgi:DNA-binding NarL/FixJ family response regulator
MSIMVVDDHEIVRAGLIATLTGRYDVVAAVGSGDEALGVARRAMPDVAVVDPRLPDTTGEDLCRTLRKAVPTMAVLVFTSYVSADTVRRSLQAGASAYVTKSAGLPELLSALQSIDEGFANPSVAPQILTQLYACIARRTDGCPLTMQQERVLELAARGFTNHEIGLRLFISESTVRFHLQKLRAKFDASSKIELVAKAMRAGAIPDSNLS